MSDDRKLAQSPRTCYTHVRIYDPWLAGGLEVDVNLAAAAAAAAWTEPVDRRPLPKCPFSGQGLGRTVMEPLLIAQRARPAHGPPSSCWEAPRRDRRSRGGWPSSESAQRRGPRAAGHPRQASGRRRPMTHSAEEDRVVQYTRVEPMRKRFLPVVRTVGRTRFSCKGKQLTASTRQPRPA